MKVKDIRDSYLAASGKVSDYTRSVNFSAIALVWVLCDQELGKIEQFKWILSLFFISLVFDYLQYLWKTFTIWLQYKREDNKVNQDENSEVRFDNYIQYGTWTCWIIKVGATVCASIGLLIYLWNL